MGGTETAREEKEELINVYKYLMRGSKEDLGRLLVLPSDRTRGSVHHLKYRKFHLNGRKNLFFYFKGD